MEKLFNTHPLMTLVITDDRQLHETFVDIPTTKRLKIAPFKAAFKNASKSPSGITRGGIFATSVILMRVEQRSIPNTVRALMESQMKCATPRNRSRSKGIDEAFSVTGALFRCIVTLEGTKGPGKTDSWLPRSGRKHSYTSSDRIRNDTEVEEVETEMAPTFQPRAERGRRTQAVDFEFERSTARQLSTCELLQSVAMTGYRQ